MHNRPATEAGRRSALTAVLRDPATWPPGFIWNNYHCKTCAVGLFVGLVADRKRPAGESTEAFMARMLGLSVEEARVTFLSAHLGYGKDNDEITPSMVADRLERLHTELVRQGR